MLSGWRAGRIVCGHNSHDPPSSCHLEMGAGASTCTSESVDTQLLAATPAELSAALAELRPEIRAKLTTALRAGGGPVPAASPSFTAPSFPCEYPMRVMRWTTFETLGSLPRSDEADKLLEEHSAGSQCLFVSHSWWHRDGQEAAPDFQVGEKKHLKFHVVVRGVRALIASEGIDPATLTIWMDWFSIDQLDTVRKAAGVRSMITYVQRCDFMLIPVPTPQVRRHNAHQPRTAVRAWAPREHAHSCMRR